MQWTATDKCEAAQKGGQDLEECSHQSFIILTFPARYVAKLAWTVI